MNLSDQNKQQVAALGASLFELRMLVGLVCRKGVFLDAEFSGFKHELFYIAKVRGLSCETGDASNCDQRLSDYDLVVTSPKHLEAKWITETTIGNTIIYIWPNLPKPLADMVVSRQPCEVRGNAIIFGDTLLNLYQSTLSALSLGSDCLHVNSQALVFDVTHRLRFFDDYQKACELAARQEEEIAGLRQYKINAEKKLMVLRKLHLPRLIKGWLTKSK